MPIFFLPEQPVSAIFPSGASLNKSVKSIFFCRASFFENKIVYANIKNLQFLFRTLFDNPFEFLPDGIFDEMSCDAKVWEKLFFYIFFYLFATYTCLTILTPSKKYLSAKYSIKMQCHPKILCKWVKEKRQLRTLVSNFRKRLASSLSLPVNETATFSSNVYIEANMHFKIYNVEVQCSNIDGSWLDATWNL